MHTRHLCATLAIAAAVFGARPVTAQQASRLPLRVALSVGSMTLDRSAAEGITVHDRTVGAQADIGVVAARFLYIGADFGYHVLSDHATFTQNTTAGEMKSSAGVAHFSLLAGPQTRPFQLVRGLPAVSLGLAGGTTLTSASRSVDNCLDCRVDDMEIPGGAFIQPTLYLGRGANRLRIADRHYVGGDGIRYLISAGLEVGRR